MDIAADYITRAEPSKVPRALDVVAAMRHFR
jgi:hypothetical protein